MKSAPFLLAVLFATAAAAGEPPPAVAAELDAALLRLADAGQLPRGADETWTISQPPRTRHELGAVLDLAAGSAAPVLAVTPGGAAERAGLRVGDRVLRLNGVAVHAGIDADALRDALDAGAGSLLLQVRRDGRELELRGAADSVALPGYRLVLAGGGADAASSCGRISLFDSFPRNRHVYPLGLIAIDGRHPGPGPVFRLAPGRYRLTVSEQIAEHQFSGVAQFQRNSRSRTVLRDPSADGSGDADRAGASRTRYKDLELDIQPGITYRIAAQFHPERRHEIRSNAYWDPIVYAEAPEACR